MRTAFVLALILCAQARADVLDDCQEVSVTVKSGNASGSGVIFQRKDGTTFVWTAAHVVGNAESKETVIDAQTGLPRVQLKYKDVEIVKRLVEKDRHVGDLVYFARVVRLGEPTCGEDIALLKVFKKSPTNGSVVFHKGEAPKPGMPIWHVGSMSGHEGAHSVSDGVFSAVGRLKEPEKGPAYVVDQVNLAALGGSSGGGVFLKADGKCIGLIRGGLAGLSESPNVIVPARVIRDFAKRTKCEWALDQEVQMGEDKELVRDRPVTPPEDFKRPFVIPLWFVR